MELRPTTALALTAIVLGGVLLLGYRQNSRAETIAPVPPPSQKFLPIPLTPPVAVSAPQHAAAPRIENARRLAILVFKKEKRLELWAQTDRWAHLKDFPVLAASGTGGPKLREGDKQVPEGIYHITELNPHSTYHLSMKIDYPNAFDRLNAQRDGRTKLGGDICIHGKNASIGCVAIGDAGINEVYAVVSKVGMANVDVIIAPCDGVAPAAFPPAPKWLPELYRNVSEKLRDIRKTDLLR